jgi:Cu/Ag efflux protein CusF
MVQDNRIFEAAHQLGDNQIMNLRNIKRIAAGCFAWLALACLFAALLGAQQSGKKSYVFKGTVESVDANAKKLTVKNEKIEGWMDAMSMKYELDNPDVLKQLKEGDRIEATVYDGDYKLYKVHKADQQKK